VTVHSALNALHDRIRKKLGALIAVDDDWAALLGDLDNIRLDAAHLADEHCEHRCGPCDNVMHATSLGPCDNVMHATSLGPKRSKQHVAPMVRRVDARAR